jgi:hypothetical protein
MPYFFLNYKVIIANSEDILQRGLHALHQTRQTFGLKISYKKYKTWLYKNRNKKKNYNRQHDIRTGEHFHMPGL